MIVITGLPGSGKTTLAVDLATRLDAVRMCPDDWMTTAGIDLWDADARFRIERFQLGLAIEQLRNGRTVIIEWGVWTRAERDELLDAARSIGAVAELRHTTADVEELWRRIEQRDMEGRWRARSIRRDELDKWVAAYEVPTDDEFAAYDPPGAR